ncbi:histone H3.3 type c-like [Rhagoletis pomonella]|uniref:histone H3.3 type c-like n=1 Tax=Rhagoletis pomonella TaxID=28610 RepID=UPI0017860C54|nr:histone H3.3 type c-like [Rhagoletis pomonella]
MRPPRKPGSNSALKKSSHQRRHPAADLGETDTSSSAEDGLAKDDQGFRSPAPDTDGTDYGLEFTNTGSRYVHNSSKEHRSVAPTTNMDKQNESCVNKDSSETLASQNRSSAKQVGATAVKPLEKAQRPLEQGALEHVQTTTASTKTATPHKRKTQRKGKFLHAQLIARTDLMIPRAAFGRLVREILLSNDTDVRSITLKALEALHVATEAYVEGRFEDANLLALHARRVTVMAKDMELINFLRNKS